MCPGKRKPESIIYVKNQKDRMAEMHRGRERKVGPNCCVEVEKTCIILEVGRPDLPFVSLNAAEGKRSRLQWVETE